jgi:hypothetical protein
MPLTLMDYDALDQNLCTNVDIPDGVAHLNRRVCLCLSKFVCLGLFYVPVLAAARYNTVLPVIDSLVLYPNRNPSHRNVTMTTTLTLTLILTLTLTHLFACYRFPRPSPDPPPEPP